MKCKSLELTITAVSFKESEVYIVYCPSLDISGYDQSEAKAKESFEVALNEYISYCIANNTLEEDLKNHGWTKKGEMPFNKLVNKNDTLKDIVDNNNFSKFTMLLPVQLHEHNGSFSIACRIMETVIYEYFMAEEHDSDIYSAGSIEKSQFIKG